MEKDKIDYYYSKSEYYKNFNTEMRFWIDGYLLFWIFSFICDSYMKNL